jgi:hypothetical protein
MAKTVRYPSTRPSPLFNIHPPHINNIPAGSLSLKSTQGFFNDNSRPRITQKHGCIVMEVEDWIDTINQPEWQRSNKQIYEPGGDPYVCKRSMFLV